MYNIGLVRSDGSIGYVRAAEAHFDRGFFAKIAELIDTSNSVDTFVYNFGAATTDVMVSHNTHKVPVVSFERREIALYDELGDYVTRWTFEDFINKYGK